MVSLNELADSLIVKTKKEEHPVRDKEWHKLHLIGMLRDFVDKCHVGETLTQFSAVIDGDLRFVPVDYSIFKDGDKNVLRIALKTRQFPTEHTENLTVLIYFGKCEKDASKMEISDVSFQYIPNSSTTLAETNPFISTTSFLPTVRKPFDIIVREMLIDLVEDICTQLPKLNKLPCGMIWPNISLTFNKHKNMYTYNVEYLYGEDAKKNYDVLWDREIAHNIEMYSTYVQDA